MEIFELLQHVDKNDILWKSMVSAPTTPFLLRSQDVSLLSGVDFDINTFCQICVMKKSICTSSVIKELSQAQLSP